MLPLSLREAPCDALVTGELGGCVATRAARPPEPGAGRESSRRRAGTRRSVTRAATSAARKSRQASFARRPAQPRARSCALPLRGVQHVGRAWRLASGRSTGSGKEARGAAAVRAASHACSCCTGQLRRSRRRAHARCRRRCAARRARRPRARGICVAQRPEKLPGQVERQARAAA